MVSKLRQIKDNLRRAFHSGSSKKNVRSNNELLYNAKSLESSRESMDTARKTNYGESSSSHTSKDDKSNLPRVPAKFARLVAECITLGGLEEGDISERVIQVTNILASHRQFHHRNDRKLSAFRTQLLDFWNFCLNALDFQDEQPDDKVLDTELTQALYSAIVKMIDRSEFDLEYFGSSLSKRIIPPTTLSSPYSGPSQQSTIHENGSTDRESLISSNFSDDGISDTSSTTAVSSLSPRNASFHSDLRKYRHLLVATLKYSVNKLLSYEGESARNDINSRPEHKDRASGMKKGRKTKLKKTMPLYCMDFLACVFSVVYIRIPYIQDRIKQCSIQAFNEREWLDVPYAEKYRAPEKQTSLSLTILEDSNANDLPNRRSSVTSPRSGSPLKWTGHTFRDSIKRFADPHSTSATAALDTPRKSQSSTGPFSPSSHSSKCSSSSNSRTSFGFSQSSEATFCEKNPTIFGWAQFVPYVDNYLDDILFGTWKEWVPRLVENAELFFAMVSYLVQQLQAVVEHRNKNISDIPWEQVPGYRELACICLYLLKEACWRQWWDTKMEDESTYDMKIQSKLLAMEKFVLSTRGVKTVLSLSPNLLTNASLSECAILAVFECTNVYDNRSVGFCLNQLEQFLSTLAHGSNSASRGRYVLPAKCVWRSQFCLGLKFMLTSDHFEILKKVLLFIYHRMDLFVADTRQYLLKLLISQHFYLFLHWNQDVRNYYHHILVYKIPVNIKLRSKLMPITDSLLLDQNKDDDGSDNGEQRTEHIVSSAQADAMISEGTNTAGSIFNLEDLENEEIDDEVSDDDNNNNTSNLSIYSKGDASDTMRNKRAYGSSSAKDSYRSKLLTDRAHWRAFDACIAKTCMNERRQARKANKEYQLQIRFAQNRAISFKKLSTEMPDVSSSTSSMNEALPGHSSSNNAQQKRELTIHEISPSPPYYLRYLSTRDMEYLKELCNLLQASYPSSLQVYAKTSLFEYSTLLAQYYKKEKEILALGLNEVDSPPLGFC